MLLISINGNHVFTIEHSISFVDRGEFVFEIFKEKGKGEFIEHINIIEIIREIVVKIIMKHVRKSVKEESIAKIIRNLNIMDDVSFLEQLKKIQSPISLKANISKWKINSPDFIEFKDSIILYKFISYFIHPINLYLKSTFSNIKYIAPLRATAERYYRIQHLAIDEVDQNGKNLPIFLDSLTDQLMIDFQGWTMTNFGFKTKISKIEGHYSIKVAHEDNYEINLSDMGFWLFTNSSNTDPDLVFFIEKCFKKKSKPF